jgi:hypothetical protein
MRGAAAAEFAFQVYATRGVEKYDAYWNNPRLPTRIIYKVVVHLVGYGQN